MELLDQVEMPVIPPGVDPNFVTLLFGSLALLLTRWAWNMLPSPDNRVNRPPLISGWLPYFGVWWDLKRAPREYLQKCYEEHGEVFTLYMCGRQYHMLMNHNDHPTFYLRPDNEVAAEASPFAATLGSEDASLFSSQPKKAIMAQVSKWLGFFHKHVARGLSGTFMREYVAGVHEEIRNGLAGLGEKGEIDIYQFAIDMSERTTIRMMLGKGFLDKNPTLHDDIMLVKHYFDTYAPDPFLKNVVMMLPTPHNFAVRRAINNIKKIFYNRIEELYEHGEGEETLLFSALKVSKGGDVIFGPAKGISLVMFLLILSATANMPVASFWALYHLNQSKKDCGEVLQDFRKIKEEVKKEGRTYFGRSDYQKMKVIDNTIKECVRLHQGPIHLGNVLRGIRQNQTVQGFVLEKGSVLCLPTHQYYDEQFYKNAQEFNPDRWNDAEWVENLPRFAFSPFGHGAHFCPGRLFAYCFIKLFVSEFMDTFNFEWVKEPVASEPPFTGVAPPEIGNGMNRIRYQRKPGAH